MQVLPELRSKFQGVDVVFSFLMISLPLQDCKSCQQRATVVKELLVDVTLWHAQVRMCHSVLCGEISFELACLSVLQHANQFSCWESYQCNPWFEQNLSNTFNQMRY